MLLETLREDLKKYQLGRDELKVSTLRMLLSEVKNIEIAKGHVLSDEEVIEVIQKEVKKRKEAAEGFRQGNREEAAVKEDSEAGVLLGYLPTQLSEEELLKIIEDAISKTGASTMSDMGKVIGVVMPQVKGTADGGRVSALVKSKLSTLAG